MKRNLKNISLLVSLMLTTIIVGFSNINQQNDTDLIIGTWIPEGCSTCKWVFGFNGKCDDYYDGNIETSYNYIIIQEPSENGKLTHSILKLVNVANPSDVYEYEINALDLDKMTLEYLGGTRSSLMYFNRE